MIREKVGQPLCREWGPGPRMYLQLFVFLTEGLVLELLQRRLSPQMRPLCRWQL